MAGKSFPANGASSSAADFQIWWNSRPRLEIATWRRQASAAVFLDLRKFFEYIRHRHLMSSGLAT
eukprot:2398876-Amphidinium_carterae.1